MGNVRTILSYTNDLEFIELTPVNTQTPTVYFGKTIIGIAPGRKVDDETTLTQVHFVNGELILMKENYKDVISAISNNSIASMWYMDMDE